MSSNRIHRIISVTRTIRRPTTAFEIKEFMDDAAISEKRINNVLYATKRYSKTKGFWWELASDPPPIPQFALDRYARQQITARSRGRGVMAAVHRELIDAADSHGRLTVGVAFRILKRALKN